jgi:hypothetical protein
MNQLISQPSPVGRGGCRDLSAVARRAKAEGRVSEGSSSVSRSARSHEPYKPWSQERRLQPKALPTTCCYRALAGRSAGMAAEAAGAPQVMSFFRQAPARKRSREFRWDVRHLAAGRGQTTLDAFEGGGAGPVQGQPDDGSEIRPHLLRFFVRTAVQLPCQFVVGTARR